jgi:hypothetical protein
MGHVYGKISNIKKLRRSSEFSSVIKKLRRVRAELQEKWDGEVF